MPSGREFSDSTKLKATIRNLKKYGRLTCEICQRNIKPEEMHYDHIEAWINGGRSILNNCQILCIDCNEKKNDKLLEEFKIEQEAENIVMSSQFSSKECKSVLNNEVRGILPKETAIRMIRDFYKVHKNIRNKDFLLHNASPVLPSIYYVRLHWGSVTKMKEQLDLNPRQYWTREECIEAVKKWIDNHRTINFRDLGSKNNLPSQTIIRKYFNTLSNLKRELNLETRPSWQDIKDIEAAVEAYVKKKGIREISAKELIYKNRLPSWQVIHREYGSMEEFEKRNNLLVRQTSKTRVDIENKLRDIFGDRERVFNNKKDLFSTLKTRERTIIQIYGSLDNFLRETHIELNRRKYKWTKKEIEEITLKYIQEKGIRIPKKSELTNLGLPCASTYSRYWSDYKIAFKSIISKNL